MARNSFLIILLSLLLLPVSLFAQQKAVAGVSQFISSVDKVVQNAEEIMGKIDGAVEAVTTSDAYYTLVDGKSISPPFAILSDNENTDYALIVNNIYIDPVYGMSAEIFMKLPFQYDKNLYFMADRVPLSANGKMLGDCRLYLVGSQTFGIGYDNAQSYSVTINGLGSVGGGFYICRVQL